MNRELMEEAAQEPFHGGLPELQRVLEDLQRKHNVLGMALVSLDGVSLAARLPENMEQQSFLDLSAGMLAFSHAMLDRLTGDNDVKSISIQHGHGRLCLRPILDGALVLSVMSDLSTDDSLVRDAATDAVNALHAELLVTH